MNETLKEKIKKLQEVEIDYFNDGSIKTESVGFREQMIERFGLKDTSEIERYLYDAAESYSYNYEFDRIDFFLKLGLVFSKYDLNKDSSIKKGAKPLNNIVRYYTDIVNSYLNDKQTNTSDYYRFGVGRQGYVLYDVLVSNIEKNGLVFNGPKTFEEFEKSILSQEKFDISISVDLNRNNEMKLSL